MEVFAVHLKSLRLFIWPISEIMTRPLIGCEPKLIEYNEEIFKCSGHKAALICILYSEHKNTLVLARPEIAIKCSTQSSNMKVPRR